MVGRAELGPGRERSFRRSRASRPDWCEAVGWYDNMSGPLTEHWDGRSWSQVASWLPSGSFRTLWGVSCTSRKWCVAVGDRLRPDEVGATVVEHWNGTKWSAVPSPNRGTTSSVLRSASCVSPSWCAAVGASYLPDGGSLSLVELWNGKSWRIVPSPSRAHELVSLAAVDCVSSTWCIAVGGDETGALIERWDGRSWTTVAHPAGARGWRLFRRRVVHVPRRVRGSRRGF